MGEIHTPILFSLVVIWLISWLVVYRGVQRGIELANKVLMPLLLVLTVTLVAWSLQLEWVWDGIKVYLKPDFS